MDSPFPGMDPYLEEPSGWPGVHHRLISVLSDALTEQVAPHYTVSIEERVYITDDEPEARQQAAHDRFLAIYDRRSRELVTTLEVLSPRNKASGSRGRSAFLAKREAVFSTRTHWIELDLLRAGERPEEVARQSDYYALLRRGDGGGRLSVWYVDLRDALPHITVPLRDPHPAVVLDLQQVFATLYTRARYADDVDYTRPAPPPTLRPADAAWVTQRVAQWRSGAALDAG